jgi:NAD(P)-dependent dehydrogenase (short-subunit alcohol dehydrogenase family)
MGGTMRSGGISLLQDFDFRGRRVLVTGAANGFGRAIATLLAAHQASLVLADCEADSLAEAALALRAEHHVYDQADLSSIDRLIASSGDVDILINCAGILVAKPILETAPDEIRRLIDVDFIGVLHLIQGIGRGMVDRRRGVILSIGSQTAFCGGEGRGVYAAAKAAVSQVTRAAAVEWGPYNVRVVCLAPGRSLTRMTVETAKPGNTSDRGLSRVPLGRWGAPEEIAKMAVFLVSDAAGYITGETLIADGGFVLG